MTSPDIAQVPACNHYTGVYIFSDSVAQLPGQTFFEIHLHQKFPMQSVSWNSSCWDYNPNYSLWKMFNPVDTGIVMGIPGFTFTGITAISRARHIHDRRILRFLL